MNQEDLYWFTFILVAILGFFTHKLLTRHRSYFRLLGVPHEKPHFLYGNLNDVLSGRLTTMEKVEQYYRKFSDHGIFGFFSYMTPTLYIRDPELIRQILQENMDHFESHGYFLDGDKDRFLGHQLHLVKGSGKAPALASLLSPVFNGADTLSAMEARMKRNCSSLLAFISSQADLELEIKTILLRHVLNVYGGCAFGKELNTFVDESDRLSIIASGMAYGTSPMQAIKTMAFYILPGLLRSANVQITDKDEVDYLVKLFQTSASEVSRNSVARLLRQANEQQANSQNQLNDEQMAAHCASFFTKGFEPTLNVLSFAAFELAQNPKIQTKLYHEIRNKTSNGNVSYDTIRSLPYLDAVVQETLRKWPPHPLLVRECTKPYTIPASEDGARSAIPLKLGDKLYVSVWALHRNSEYYPYPEQFKPERFAQGSGANIAPNTFIPFGIGRGCLGQKLSIMVVKASLVALVHRFILKPSERTEAPITLLEAASTLESRDGFWIRLEPRFA